MKKFRAAKSKSAILQPETENFRKLYAEQLPKRQSFSLKDIMQFAVLAVYAINLWILSFGGTSGAPLWALTYLLIFLGLFNIVFSSNSYRRRWRAAEAIIHLHASIHAVRDCVASYDKDPTLSEALKDVLNSASHAMSIVNGAQCYATIKELDNYPIGDKGEKENKCKIIAMNDDYAKILPRYNLGEFLSKDYTSIDSLLAKRNGCSRYYLCNDIKRSWKERKYNNPVLVYAQATITRWGRVENWDLPYLSTLVVPIRYIVCGKEEIKADYATHTKLEKTDYDESIVRGMLCFDCVEKNRFDQRYSVELAAAYADLVYILLSQIDMASEYYDDKIGEAEKAQEPAMNGEKHVSA